MVHGDDVGGDNGDGGDDDDNGGDDDDGDDGGGGCPLHPNNYTFFVIKFQKFQFTVTLKWSI
jgi:hypothetical protein